MTVISSCGTHVATEWRACTSTKLTPAFSVVLQAASRTGGNLITGLEFYPARRANSVHYCAQRFRHELLRRRRPKHVPGTLSQPNLESPLHKQPSFKTHLLKNQTCKSPEFTQHSSAFYSCRVCSYKRCKLWPGYYLEQPIRSSVHTKNHRRP
jgi:hypothetical protein